MSESNRNYFNELQKERLKTDALSVQLRNAEAQLRNTNSVEKAEDDTDFELSYATRGQIAVGYLDEFRNRLGVVEIAYVKELVGAEDNLNVTENVPRIREELNRLSWMRNTLRAAIAIIEHGTHERWTRIIEENK